MRQLVITKSITKRDSTSFEKYLQDIGKIELLTPEEEIELAQKIRKGDQHALNKLVSANLRFVVSVAKKYQNRGLNIQDLINEGNLGLIKAARLFDETKGFKFISYAVWWIRQSILSAVACQSRMVRLPINKLTALSQINKLTMQYQQDHNRMPSNAELADLMNVSAYKLSTILQSNSHKVSLDAPVKTDEHKSLVDFMEDKEAVTPEKLLMHQSLNFELKRLLNTLSEAEKTVLTNYYGFEGHSKSFLEIGEKMNISRERVRQIKEKAIRKLKRPVKRKLLMEYLAQ